jgi:hypothetical protein
MTDFDDNDAFDTEEEKAKKKRKGETETGAQGRENVNVSEGFYSYMTSIGASPSLIASILKSWRHLTGQGLLRAISDFITGAKNPTRATAHVEVEIDKDKNYSLLDNLIRFFKGMGRAPTHAHKMDQNRFGPK